MKRIIKRSLCLLLTMALLAGLLPMGALAAGTGVSAMLESVEGSCVTDIGLNVERKFAALASEEVTDMYSQLSTRQKACYNAVLEISLDRILTAAVVNTGGKAYHRVTVHIDGMDGTALTGALNGGQFVPAASAKSVEAELYTDLCAALVALRYDRPDLIWIGYMRYGYRVVQSGDTGKVSGIMFDFHLEYNGMEKEMHARMMENAQTIAANASTAPTTYGKVKAVYEALAEYNVYGKTEEALSHTAYSALVQDDAYQPVCDGYAKAFKVVCRLMDIECTLASSVGHMWNNVLMDDGDWYNLDLTWDDDDIELTYEYFLVGSQTEIAGEVFSKQRDHVEQNPYNDYLTGDAGNILKPVTLRYPLKNKKSYVPLGVDYDPLSFRDVRRSTWYYGAVEDAYAKGLFAGDEMGLFRPGKNITRAEFALVMAKALNVDLSAYKASPFKDVPAGKWYSAAIAWAKSANVVSGYKDGAFRPNNYITRQEMCAVLYNALTVHPELGAERFPDDAKISGWAKNAVYSCHALGLVSGDEKGFFDPEANTLRSQAASIFSRFTELDPSWTAPVAPAPETPEGPAGSTEPAGPAEAPAETVPAEPEG